MMIIFEVHIAKGGDPDNLFSKELLEETQAQVMTTDEAKAVGFSGMPDDPQMRLVAVIPRDKGFVQQALERSPDVTGFQVHEVDM